MAGGAQVQGEAACLNSKNRECQDAVKGAGSKSSLGSSLQGNTSAMTPPPTSPCREHTESQAVEGPGMQQSEEEAWPRHCCSLQTPHPRQPVPSTVLCGSQPTSSWPACLGTGFKGVCAYQTSLSPSPLPSVRSTGRRQDL